MGPTKLGPCLTEFLGIFEMSLEPTMATLMYQVDVLGPPGENSDMLGFLRLLTVQKIEV